MELQKVYDDTVRHLHRQGKASKSKVVSQSSGHAMIACAYRGLENTKCAVGYWIPDDRYSPLIEGQTVSRSIGKLDSPLRCLPAELVTQDILEILRELQIAHDNALCAPTTLAWITPWDTGGIASRLGFVATRHNLSMDALLECWPR
jgi:hypothetical protein